MNSNCSNLLDLRHLQEQVKKAFCYQKLFWPFTVQTNCSNDLNFFANSQPSVSNFKSFSWSIGQFFLTVLVGQNNFDNKIPNHNSNAHSKIFRSIVHRFPGVHPPKNRVWVVKICHFWAWEMMLMILAEPLFCRFSCFTIIWSYFGVSKQRNKQILKLLLKSIFWDFP